MPLLPSKGVELAVQYRHRRFRDDGGRLPPQVLLTGGWAWYLAAINLHVRLNITGSSQHLMIEKNKTTSRNPDAAPSGEQWPGIDSRYRLIVVAAFRAKQLQRGAHPRIEADQRRRRNTSIALEETKRGLVPFTNGNIKSGGDGNGSHGNS